MNFLVAIFRWLTDRIVIVEFTKAMRIGGGWIVLENKDVAEFLRNEEDPHLYMIFKVNMTKHQFNNLPEFNGF